jgi:hypothetical protein
VETGERVETDRVETGVTLKKPRLDRFVNS